MARARTASVSGSAPSASAEPRPHLAGATPEQHRIFLLGARSATAHRHGLLPRTLPGSLNDDFRHGASGTGRVRWPGGSQRPPTRFQLTPPTSVFSLSPLHLSSSSFFFLTFPSVFFQFIFLPPALFFSFFKSASLYSLGWPLLPQLPEFGMNLHNKGILCLLVLDAHTNY